MNGFFLEFFALFPVTDTTRIYWLQ